MIDHDLDLIIRDNVPAFAENTLQLVTQPDDQGGKIEKHLRAVVADSEYKGSVVLLMGGIGSGKTTFLKRFFKVVAPDFAVGGGKVLRIHIDFLGAPDRIEEMDEFLWHKSAEALRKSEAAFNQRKTLEIIFESRLSLMRQIYHDQDEQLADKIADELFKLASNAREFTLAAIGYCLEAGRLPLVVFDNVDQLGIDLQAHIFTTTEHLANHYGCLAILVIREETFSTAKMQKQLTAYSIRAYHLSSPSFRDLLKLRIDFATNAAARRKQQRIQGELTGFDEEQSVPADEILEFFTLLRNSVFTENYTIIRLLEAISFGNMRLALQLFSNFLISGATNMPKILAIFRAEGRYMVPFHEFAKSVILGDYRFYKESRSYIYNLFYITPARNSSHFTSLRILHYLAHSADNYQGGEGFVDLQGLITTFVEIFDNEDDCLKSLLRMVAVNRQLIEFDTRRPDTLAGACALRITSAGKYYLEHFIGSFSYLDLVWHDTPIVDPGTCHELSKLMHATDLLERLRRVDLFLNYLEQHELHEAAETGLAQIDSTLNVQFMPKIKAGYSREKKGILKYVRSFVQNRAEPFGQKLNLDGFAEEHSHG